MITVDDGSTNFSKIIMNSIEISVAVLTDFSTAELLRNTLFFVTPSEPEPPKEKAKPTRKGTYTFFSSYPIKLKLFRTFYIGKTLL